MADGPDQSKPPAQPAGGGKTGGSEPNPLVFLGAGIEFVAVAGLLTAAGWWLDGKFGTSPVLLMIGLFIGVTGETYKLWRLGKRFFQ